MATDKSIYQFKVKDVHGKEVSLEDYKGKVLMIVNTASKCGFTPQLEGMTEVYREFKDQGFEVLAFPSNDFAGQEPLEGAEIEQFCVMEYDAEYPIFQKTHVKGKEQSELFGFLSSKKLNGKVGSRPRWNFYKYLVDREGRVNTYYTSITKPNSGRVKKRIRKLLEE